MNRKYFVSPELAKLLEEKGFNEDCDYSYVDGSLYNNYDEDFPSMYELLNIEDNVINAPTFQMAVSWLRENYQINISVDIETSENPIEFPPKYYCYVCSVTNGYSLIEYGEGKTNELTIKNGNEPRRFDSPEEAFETAIMFVCKNLI